MNLDISYFSKLDRLLEHVYTCGATKVVIAGGAVRDHVLNKPIKDIDVFYEGTLDLKKAEAIFGKMKDKPKSKPKNFDFFGQLFASNVGVTANAQTFATQGMAGSPLTFLVNDPDGAPVNPQPASAAVPEGDFDGMAYENTFEVSTYGGDSFSFGGLDIQLIKVENTQEHIDKFPCYISRLTYDGEKLVVPFEAIQDISLQILRFTEECDPRYQKKIEAKYEEWL